MAGPAHRLAQALALLVPVALLAGALAWLGEAREVPPSARVLTLDGLLRAAGTVDTVVVGNSKARTDIDDDALARALGRPPGSVVGLDVPASTAPSWYAVLANRVYAQGYRPGLVVVYGPLSMALDTKVYSAQQRQALEELLGPSEPVLGPKVLGRAGGATFLDRARERRTELHNALLAGLKEASVRVAYGDPTLADPALDRLFGAGAKLAAGGATRHRVIPIAELEGPVIASRDVGAESSLLRDFVALARTHGSRIVFVRSPVSDAARAGEAVPPAVARDVVLLLNEEGAGWLDLSATPLPPGSFRDELHLNQKGATALTAALAAGLRQLGAVGEGPLASAAPPLAPSGVERVGALPALPAPAFTRTASPCGWSMRLPELAGLSDGELAAAGLGAVSPLVVTADGAPLTPRAAKAEFAESCGGAFAHFAREVKAAPTGRPDGPHDWALGLSPDLPLRTGRGDEAWWIYPGTSLRWTFPDAVEGAVVEAVVRTLGEAHVALTVGPASLPFTGRARLAVPAAPGGWTIDLAGAGWAVVESLAVIRGAETTWIVGQPPSPAPLLGGKLVFAAAPPPVRVDGALTPHEGALRRLHVPGTAAHDDPTTAAATGAKACSPVQILADGKPLTAPHTALADVNRLGAGRYRHEGDWLYVGAPNPLAPEAAGHAWTAALDPERRCDVGRWLYPGDQLSVAAPLDALRRLRRGATQLVVTGFPFGGDGEAVRVRLRVKDAVVVDAEVPAATWAAGPVTWRLDPPLPPRANPVVLEVATTRGSPWLVLAQATLEEDPLPLAPGSAP